MERLQYFVYGKEHFSEEILSYFRGPRLLPPTTPAPLKRLRSRVDFRAPGLLLGLREPMRSGGRRYTFQGRNCSRLTFGGVSRGIQLPEVCAAKPELIGQWERPSHNGTQAIANRQGSLPSLPSHRSPIRGLGADASGPRSGLRIRGL